MKIKKFTAENSQEALQKIKQVLGEDAILLSMDEKYEYSCQQLDCCQREERYI